MLASSSTLPVAPSTNTTPITASWTSGQTRSVQVSSNAPPSAAATAATCTAAPSGSNPSWSASSTPHPAICAMARSMKTMPRASTCVPSGTCVAVTSTPATNAGSRIDKSSALRLIAHP
ncbi:MAG: hypothetical protein AUH79_07820 [Betaproteobacteria bacterium 13_1_40CM_4_64_4]|nr:MAG: hypothetical protein AUH79_07820 [Betaproteobacteria bacterium 13_1_40CM_4_64_4]